MVPVTELSCTGIVEPILVVVAIVNVLGMGVLLDVDAEVILEDVRPIPLSVLDNSDVDETVIGVVVGIDGSTDDDDESGLSVTSSIVGKIREPVEDPIDVLTLYCVDDEIERDDDVSSAEIELLDDHMLEDDTVVDGTLEEVPRVVSVITFVDEERVRYDVENVLNDSDTVVGVTVGISVKLSVDEAVVLMPSPPIVSIPVKEVVNMDVS